MSGSGYETASDGGGSGEERSCSHTEQGDTPTGSGMWPRWRPTSSTELARSEKRVMAFIKTPLSIFNTQTSHGKVRTFRSPDVRGKLPLVMLHGMGAGAAMWVLNIDSLAKHRQVFAIDVLGFGRSSRPTFPSDPQGVEEMFVSNLEEWRKENSLEKFTLLGHSFGGYIACLYTLKYPERVRHLVLADPWGLPPMPDRTEPLPLRWRLVINVMKPFNIFSGLRAAGPLGPSLINKIRPDLQKKFSGRMPSDPDAISNYIYHCNVQNPSGEVAFKMLHAGLGFAKRPMLDRIGKIQSGLPISMVYGASSWMDPSIGYAVQEARQGEHVTVELILRAGHHVYADDPERFNTVVSAACSTFENIS